MTTDELQSPFRLRDGWHKLDTDAKRKVLCLIADTARVWNDQIMSEPLRGARCLAVTLLIDADMTMTEAELLVDGAIASALEPDPDASQLDRELVQPQTVR